MEQLERDGKEKLVENETALLDGNFQRWDLIHAWQGLIHMVQSAESKLEYAEARRSAKIIRGMRIVAMSQDNFFQFFSDGGMPNSMLRMLPVIEKRLFPKTAISVSVTAIGLLGVFWVSGSF